MKYSIAAIAFSLAGLGLVLPSQAQLTAHEALQKVKDQYGDEPLQGIVELVGQKGMSQPTSWKLVFFDSGNDYKLRTFQIRESGIRDDGPNDEFYPGRVPAGFIAMKDVRIGSRDAIEKADTAAKLAKVGFASVDYVLRARELTSEPLWILKLKNSKGLVVGTVFISADNGGVLRNQFVYHNQATRSGEPRFMDSAIRDLREKNSEKNEVEPDTTEAPLAPPAPNPAAVPDARPVQPSGSASQGDQVDRFLQGRRKLAGQAHSKWPRPGKEASVFVNLPESPAVVVIPLGATREESAPAARGGQ